MSRKVRQGTRDVSPVTESRAVVARNFGHYGSSNVAVSRTVEEQAFRPAFVAVEKRGF